MAVLHPYTASLTGVASTSSYAAVPGSTMDLGGTFLIAMYQIAETGGVNGITAKVQASVDGQTWFDATTASLASDGSTASSIAQAVAAGAALVLTAFYIGRFTRLVVIDTVGGSHGTLNAIGYGNAG